MHSSHTVPIMTSLDSSCSMVLRVFTVADHLLLLSRHHSDTDDVLKRKYEPTPLPTGSSEPFHQEPTQELQLVEHLPVSRVDERKVVIGFDTEGWTRL